MKTILHTTIVSLALFSLVGCGDSSCCDGMKAVAVQENTTNSVNLEEKGAPAAALTPSSVNFLPPSATILVNGEDNETTTQGCNPLKLEAQSNDPDGNNLNLTFQWYVGTALLGEGKKFCYKIEDAGLHDVKLVVTDEDNMTNTDTLVVTVP